MQNNSKNKVKFWHFYKGSELADGLGNTINIKDAPNWVTGSDYYELLDNYTALQDAVGNMYDGKIEDTLIFSGDVSKNFHEVDYIILRKAVAAFTKRMREEKKLQKMKEDEIKIILF